MHACAAPAGFHCGLAGLRAACEDWDGSPSAKDADVYLAKAYAPTAAARPNANPLSHIGAILGWGSLIDP